MQFGVEMPPVRPTTPGDPHAAAELLNQVASGRTVRSVTVHGPNSLKTLAPLSNLSGQKVMSVSTEGNMVLIELAHALLKVDLQRTGAAAFKEELGEWTSPGTQRPPTVRIRFDDGSGVDLSEPGRTKRIAIWMTELGEA